MKQLKKDLNAVLKGLKALTQKTEGMAKRLAKLDEAKVPKKAKVVKKTVGKKPKRVTAIDTVFAIIMGSRNGVDTSALIKKTGFDKIKVRNNVNMLKTKGKIKAVKRGVYVKA